MVTTSFLVTMIYVYFNWKNGRLGRLMSITLILISYGLFTSFNAVQGFYIYLPHLARTGYLVLFMISPLLYLSLRRGLPNMDLKRKDWLHFLPAVIYFINYLPFFFYSAEKKVELITNGEFITFDEGLFFPKYFVIVLSISQIFFYLSITTWQLIFPSIKEKIASKEEKRFIYTFYTYLFLLLFPPLTSIYAGFSGKYGTSPLALTYISSQTIFFLVLLSQPRLIYPNRSVPRSNPSQMPNSDSLDKNPRIELLHPLATIDKDSQEILERISSYFEKEKPFLDFDFDQTSVVEKLNLSGYQLRNSLKNGYSISFSDFVNYHRIQYLLEMLDKNPTWRRYTMATLANSIGFKSTNSLYLAFKKLVKMTPKDYIDQLEDSSNNSVTH
jgi:AraC-like DNA-binding protein